MTETTSELNEIRALIATIRPLETPAAGSSDPVSAWLESAQGGKSAPKLEHPRLSVFSAAHGFAEAMKLPSDFDYGKFIQGCLSGTGRLNRLAQSINTDLRLYEMDGEDKSGNPLDGQSALDEHDLVRCMAYGMMAVEPGLDLLALDAFGHGSAASARALIALHTERPLEDLTAMRLAKQAPDLRGLDALAKVGGYELAAMCGAIIAARLANCPVLIGDTQGLAALLLLCAENPALADHCRLCGAAKDGMQGLSIAVPAIKGAEPGLTLACAIQHLRTHVILNERTLAA